MTIQIDTLQVTVRIRTAPRAPVADLEQRPDRKHASQLVHLMAPPKPHAASVEAQAPLTAGEEGEEAAWDIAAVDPNELAERVYEFMRYDIRVARERSGTPGR